MPANPNSKLNAVPKAGTIPANTNSKLTIPLRAPCDCAL